MHASKLAIICMLCALALPPATWAQTYQVLHNFGSGQDGSVPEAALVFDAQGNLYGATLLGGANRCGTIFQLSPNSDGTWSESVLYTFQCTTDGAYPESALTFDSRGNLYGTSRAACADGCQPLGEVFELASLGNGQWHFLTLLGFNGANGGCVLHCLGVTLDSAGHIYGASWGSGENGNVYELLHLSALRWTELMLHDFLADNDGMGPSSSLTLDAGGNLYGTTLGGGAYQAGTVFKLTPNRGGAGWRETILYSFTGGTDGGYPSGKLTFDAQGDLYGTAESGGVSDSGCAPYRSCGVVFELTPNPDGSWSESVPYAFQSHADGIYPASGVVFDAAGNLYGVTDFGGNNGCSQQGCGTVFKLSPGSGGQWTKTLLHVFNGDQFGNGDGSNPYSGIVLDSSNNLFGVTAMGGTSQAGVAYEIRQ